MVKKSVIMISIFQLWRENIEVQTLQPSSLLLHRTWLTHWIHLPPMACQVQTWLSELPFALLGTIAWRRPHSEMDPSDSYYPWILHLSMPYPPLWWEMKLVWHLRCFKHPPEWEPSMAKTSYQSKVHWRMDERPVLEDKNRVSPYLKIPLEQCNSD